MDIEAHELNTPIGDALWWHGGMEAISRAVIERNYPRGDSATGGLIKILAAGRNTDTVMEYLADYGRVTSLDIASTQTLADSSFDLIALFNEVRFNGLNDLDEQIVLDEYRRALKRGGRMFLRLPAYEWLGSKRSPRDKAENNLRRYTRNDIEQTLTGAGFKVEHISYANTFLFPLAAFRRLVIERISRRPINIGDTNTLFEAILSAEAKWVARRGLPFGATVMALARKP